MKIQNLAIAAVAGTVFLFLIDWLWYGMLMKDSMTMPDAKPEPDFMWLILSYIVFSVAFVSIYGSWSGGSSKVNAGLNFGVWIGMMVGLALSLLHYSLSTSMTLNHVLVNAGYTIVKCILLGIIVAYASGHPGGAGGKTIKGGD